MAPLQVDCALEYICLNVYSHFKGSLDLNSIMLPMFLMPQATNMYTTAIKYTFEYLNDNGTIEAEMID